MYIVRLIVCLICLRIQTWRGTEVLQMEELTYTVTQPIFRLTFLENEALNEETLFLLFCLFLHVESPANRLYRLTSKTLCV